MGLDGDGESTTRNRVMSKEESNNMSDRHKDGMEPKLEAKWWQRGRIWKE